MQMNQTTYYCSLNLSSCQKNPADIAGYSSHCVPKMANFINCEELSEIIFVHLFWGWDQVENTFWDYPTCNGIGQVKQIWYLPNPIEKNQRKTIAETISGYFQLGNCCTGKSSIPIEFWSDPLSIGVNPR